MQGLKSPLQVAFDRAMALRSVKRYAEALQELQGCLAIEPDNAEALAWMAEVLRQQDRLPEAAEKAQRAIQASPDQACGYQALARVQLEQGLPGTAERSARRALEIEVTSFRLGLLGLALVNQRKPKESLPFNLQGLELNAGEELCQLVLGYAYLDLDRTSEAEALYLTMVEKDPEGVGLEGLARTRMAQGRPAEAQRLALSYLRLFPELASARKLYLETLKAGFPLYRWACRIYDKKVSQVLAVTSLCYLFLVTPVVDGLRIPWGWWDALLLLPVAPFVLVDVIDSLCDLKLAGQPNLRKFLHPLAVAKSTINLLFLASFPWLAMVAPVAPRTWAMQWLITSTTIDQNIVDWKWRPVLFSLALLCLGAGLRAFSQPWWALVLVYGVHLAGSCVGRDLYILLQERQAGRS